MTMFVKFPLRAWILSFSRKCASSSPTSLASSFARPMRAGAMNRLSIGACRITSASAQVGSAIASYVLRVIVRRSRNEMLLLACGSRSMSSVLLPRMASAAARFTAVVVFPTPPFWLAIATIIGLVLVDEAGCRDSRDGVRMCQTPQQKEPGFKLSGGYSEGGGGAAQRLRLRRRQTRQPNAAGQ